MVKRGGVSHVIVHLINYSNAHAHFVL